MTVAPGNLDGKRIHLLGIGGIGVSALARLLKQSGLEVSGCDVRPSSIIDALVAEGIPVDIGHSIDHVHQNDVMVYSTAVPKGNRELAFALESGKPTLHRSHLLGALVDSRTSVGVTGTNGKGTVSSMLTWILQVANRQPGFYIGALCPNLGTNADLGAGTLLVAELDESDGSLLNTHPKYAVLNNLELDHLNYYKDFDHAVEVLVTFLRHLPDDAVCFVNADDPGAMRVAQAVPERRIVLFGQSPDAHWRFEPLQVSNHHSSFRWFHKDRLTQAQEFQLKVPGAYNIENAAAALAVAMELGVPVEAARKALATYEGLINRYTLIEAAGRSIIKDYMSHPMGIRKVIETARLGHPRRLVAVFKPYRYTMIHYHAENYADAFQGADEVIITEMWDGGEEPIPGVDTRWLADKIAARGIAVTYIPEMEAIVDHLALHQKEGDCSVFFGGNDLFALAEELAGRFGGTSHASR